jgi:Zinc finger, C3HC4 type (RING finger)
MECSVCMEVCNRSKVLRCKHTFCSPCIKAWYLKSDEPTCPMCRGPITFTGMLSCGWLQEKSETSDDTAFQNAVDALMNEFQEDNEHFGPPNSYDKFAVMEELQRVQDNYNAVSELDWGLDEEDMEVVITDPSVNFNPRRAKWVYTTDPIKEKHHRRTVNRGRVRMGSLGTRGR